MSISASSNIHSADFLNSFYVGESFQRDKLYDALEVKLDEIAQVSNDMFSECKTDIEQQEKQVRAQLDMLNRRITVINRNLKPFFVVNHCVLKTLDFVILFFINMKTKMVALSVILSNKNLLSNKKFSNFKPHTSTALKIGGSVAVAACLGYVCYSNKVFS